MNWIRRGDKPEIWINQGGAETISSYGFDHEEDVPQAHKNFFFNDALMWYVDEKNRIFVHGGFDHTIPIEKQPLEQIIWDRDLLKIAMKRHIIAEAHSYPRQQVTEYAEVFLGHTTTQFFDRKDEPLHFCEVWAMDTGAGYNGKLTIMDVDTKEYWQSGYVDILYNNDRWGKCVGRKLRRKLRRK
jgi:serine/threonine protein phosphatase 1